MRRGAALELLSWALLVAAVAAVYAAVRHHAFIEIDDPQLVVFHPAHRDPLSWASVTAAFTRPYHMNWIPLTSLSLQLDVWLWGIDAGRTLLLNVALHALGSLLLWRALVCLTGDRWRSLFVAAVFALHPLHVESVAWASSRKDVLAGIFFALTLHAHARFARRPSPRRYAAVALALTLGLLSKPVLVTLPFLLLLLDYWPLERLRAPGGGFDRVRALRVALEKLPLLALSLGAVAVTIVAQRLGGAMRHLEDLSLAARVANALLAYVHYLGDALWPSGLAPVYPQPSEDVRVWAAAAAGALLVLVSGLAWQQRIARPQLAVGWFWFLGLLVPVLGLVPMGYAARADRYMYLPLTGLTMALAWSVPAAVLRTQRGRTAVAASAGALLLALATAAHAQVSHWRNIFTLMERTLVVTRDNAVAHLFLARAYARRGELERARPHFEAVFRLEPEASLPRFEWGHLLDRSGALDEAIASYRQGVALEPGFALGRRALADALARASGASTDAESAGEEVRPRGADPAQ